MEIYCKKIIDTERMVDFYIEEDHSTEEETEKEEGIFEYESKKINCKCCEKHISKRNIRKHERTKNHIIKQKKQSQNL